MLIKIPLREGTREHHIDKCMWLNINNIEYENNIKKLRIIQKFITKIIMSKRLMRLIPKIIPLYYHPECKGGYMHKKQMLVDIQWR